jgi:hypothetical protein
MLLISAARSLVHLSEFRFRLNNAHLLPKEELSRAIIIELAYLSKADTLAEKRVLEALDKYEEQTFDYLLTNTRLSEKALDETLEVLKFKKLVEWG